MYDTWRRRRSLTNQRPRNYLRQTDRQTDGQKINILSGPALQAAPAKTGLAHTCKNLKPFQNSSEYGFTERVTYLICVLQIHEAEKICVGLERIFFGCSLDGDSALKVINRAIQTGEL